MHTQVTHIQPQKHALKCTLARTQPWQACTYILTNAFIHIHTLAHIKWHTFLLVLQLWHKHLAYAQI